MPKEPKNLDLSAEDIKRIIHGLRMVSLSFIETDVIDTIQSKINSLPSPEEIDDIVVNKRPLNVIKGLIGQILYLIDIYGNRNPEFKVRYKAKTRIPPRYKILDWVDK